MLAKILGDSHSQQTSWKSASRNYRKEIIISVHKDLETKIFIAVLHKITKNWRKSNNKGLLK